MNRFISMWSILSVLSAAVAIDFYIAIHENANPTGEQIMVACFMIALFAICALIFIGAHIEKIISKNNN